METRISAPIQTGPGAHPAAYTMGTGSLQGVKRPGRGVDRPPTSSASLGIRGLLEVTFVFTSFCNSGVGQMKRSADSGRVTWYRDELTRVAKC